MRVHDGAGRPVAAAALTRTSRAEKKKDQRKRESKKQGGNYLDMSGGEKYLKKCGKCEKLFDGGKDVR